MKKDQVRPGRKPAVRNSRPRLLPRDSRQINALADAHGDADYENAGEFPLGITNRSLFGIYPSGRQAVFAVSAMMDAGILSGTISLLLPRAHARVGAHNNLYRGESGKVILGTLGGTLGVLVGVGALEIARMSAINAIGPIVAGVAAAGEDGTIDGLIVALVSLGLSTQCAMEYEERLKAGAALLSVRCSSKYQVARARRLMQLTHAEDLAMNPDCSFMHPSPGHGLRSEARLRS